MPIPVNLRLPLFILATVACGSLIGIMNIPGAWYQGLNKPSFNPPDWIFGPVWTALYALIGIAGWRVWQRSRDTGLRMLWAVQMALNFAWSPAFFGLQQITLALVIILLLLTTIIAFIWRARQAEPLSAGLFLPYLAWVGFATLLNAAIWWLN